MNHLFRLGPIETDEGAGFIYVLATPRGLEPLRASEDSAAVKEAVSRVGSALSCEPALARAAEPFSVRAAELPKPVAVERAIMGLVLSSRGMLTAIRDRGLLLELIDATAAFEDAEPWNVFEADVPFDVELKGAAPARLEGCVMGQAGDQLGLALYFAPGSVQTLAEMMDSGRPEDGTALDTMALLLEEEPEYVLHALSDISGPASVPSVMRLKRGEPKALDETELRALVASLFAVADHCGGGPGRGESVAGKKITAKLRLRAVAEEVTPPEASRFAGVGRNAPCPCGSGKKFKRCHADAPAAPRPSPSLTRREDVHERDRRLVTQLAEYGRHRFGRERMEKHFLQPFGARQVQSQLAGSLACYDTPIDGRPLAAHFLADEGPTLSEDDRRWLEAQLGSRLGRWEVIEVERGRGLELLELPTGRRCFVEERRASTTLPPRALVLGRVVGLDGTFVLCGIHERTLPPRQARLLVERVRREGGPEMETSRLLAAWDEAVGAQALAEATPSRMLNTDGESVHFVEQKLGLRKGSRDEVVSRLLALDGVRVSEDTAKATVLAITREKNAMHQSWKNTSLASVRITQRQAVLSANSRERAERFTRLLQETLGELATLGERTEQAPPELRGQGDVHLDGQLLEGPPNPWQLGRSVLEEWLDTPLPALGGLTPRAAATPKQAREDLHWLLKEMEHRGSAARDGAGALDARLARRVLGLDELGEPLPHHELELAVGAGRKISETLLAYAQPLIDEGGAQDKAHLESTLKFAVTAWNAVIAHDRDPRALGEARRLLSGGAGSRALLERFDGLVRRKRERFPHDQRSVAKFEVVKKGRGELGVMMMASVTPELKERLERAGIKP